MGTGDGNADGNGVGTRHVLTGVPTDVPIRTAKVNEGGAGRRDGRDVALWSAIWSITLITTAMAATGQIAVWTWAGENPGDLRRFGVPFIFEVGVIAWLLIGRHAIKKERSPFPWWAVAAAFSGLAVYAQCVHGTARQALIFGTASAVSLALWFAKFYLDYIGTEVGKGLRIGATAKVLLSIRTLEMPRIRWRAHLIAGRIPTERVWDDNKGVEVEVPLTLARLIQLADLWIAVRQEAMATDRLPGWFLPREATRGNRRVAKRTAWHVISQQCGVPVIEPKAVPLAKITFAERPARPVPAILRPSSTELDVLTPTPRRAATHRVPTVRHTVQAPARSTEQPPPAESFEKHSARILFVQEVTPNWVNDERLTTVEAILKIARQYPDGPSMSNRTTASDVAKCLRELRRQALADQTAPTT